MLNSRIKNILEGAARGIEHTEDKNKC